MDIGVESAHGFGDCLFNIPLLKTISQKLGKKVDVAVTQHCADAFINVPWINNIIQIPSMHHGIKVFSELGYKHVYQATQNVKFFVYKELDPNHSLIDTPLWAGREFGLQDFDQRPMFFPTDVEMQTGQDYGQLLNGHPTIAIECIAKSAQSWADQSAIQMIVDKYISTHKILWLSNQGAPQHHNIDDLLRFTRRQNIMLLQHCEIFFSVGSGFFCANLALHKELQAKRVVCLWVDDLYKYEYRLAQLKWHENITWVHNHKELQATLGL